MYTVCTARVAQFIETPGLAAIPRGFVYVALKAWCLAALGMFRQLLGRVRPAVR